MRILFITFITAVSLLFFYCSEDNPESPSETGKLVVQSIPSGAQIYFQGVNTGKYTPDTLTNLVAGDYDLYLFLQYYDTAYFTATVNKNLITTKEIILKDGLPIVDILIDYSTFYGGDSVKFFYTINQDLLIDSIMVERPITNSGTYIKDRYDFNGQTFLAFDQSSNPIRYYLPPSEFGVNYYLKIDNLAYRFNFFGHKAYGAKVFFYLSFQMNI